MKIATSELEHLREEVKNFHQIIKDLQKKREFVGLTDEQITQVIKSMPRGIKGWMSDWDLYEFSKAIEAKLKQKNT